MWDYIVLWGLLFAVLGVVTCVNGRECVCVHGGNIDRLCMLILATQYALFIIIPTDQGG
jgi:hypothetical protein